MVIIHSPFLYKFNTDVDIVLPLTVIPLLTFIINSTISFNIVIISGNNRVLIKSDISIVYIAKRIISPIIIINMEARLSLFHEITITHNLFKDVCGIVTS